MFIFGVILAVTCTFFVALESVVAKKENAKHHAEYYSIAFSARFGATVFFGILLLMGADFAISSDSLPTLILRILAEFLLAILVIKGILVANLTTGSITSLLSIPGLLIVDLLIGYEITPIQIGGIFALMLSVVVLTFNNKLSRNGLGYFVAASLVSVATTSLYKYNIENYNSVVGEQLVVTVALMLFFAAMMMVHTRNPIKVFRNNWSKEIALFHGAVSVLHSFALSFLPPSILIAVKRGSGVGWSLLFGVKTFHEAHVAQKVMSALAAVLGIVLITIG